VLFFAIAALSAKSITLLFGGDIMLNGITPSGHTFQEIGSVASRVDTVLGNLEIPLTTSTTKTSRKTPEELKRKDQWILKGDPKHVPFLKSTGIQLVSLANNHAMDYGAKGLSQMISSLDSAGISHAGAERTAALAMAPTIWKSPKGVRVALLSVLGFQTTKALLKTTPATVTSPGIGVLNLRGSFGPDTQRKLKGWIRKAHLSADIVIVAIHWGVERKSLPNPYQVQLGRLLIDSGADIVWGNHPHVLQGAELYKHKLIMYSMGNFISSTPAQNGFFQVKWEKDGLQSPAFYPGRISGGRVGLVSGKGKAAAFREMHRLCQLLLQHYPSPVSKSAL